MANLDIHPSNTCFLMVSPDYSAIATQHLSHSLSMDGEIFHIEAVNVPFPDEDVSIYKDEFTQNFMKWQTKWDFQQAHITINGKSCVGFYENAREELIPDNQKITQLDKHEDSCGSMKAG